MSTTNLKTFVQSVFKPLFTALRGRYDTQVNTVMQRAEELSEQVTELERKLATLQQQYADQNRSLDEVIDRVDEQSKLITELQNKLQATESDPNKETETPAETGEEK